MKRAHFNGLDDGWNRFSFFLFLFLMYKVCARALNVFIVIPKMHGFLLHREILAGVH